MSIILGTGAYRYGVVDSWATLPPGREFNADVAAVGEIDGGLAVNFDMPTSGRG